jgi:acyl-CoA synthetase
MTSESHCYCCISHQFFQTASTNPNKIAVIHASAVANGDITTLLQQRVESTSPPLYHGDRSFTYSHLLNAVSSLSSRLRSILNGADDPHLITAKPQGSSQRKFENVVEFHSALFFSVIFSCNFEHL